jgi:hypothetical protein
MDGENGWLGSSLERKKEVAWHDKLRADMAREDLSQAWMMGYRGRGRFREAR